MPIDPRTLLQIVILSVGAHIVLSFLRTTRGTGMVRGVLIVLIVVFGLLLGLARSFALAELSFIVDALTGFVVVILAIVFQPELRRGIISLGDNPLLRTVIGAGGKDVVDEVAAACVTMAKRNQGALIAFERRVALDAWTQKAVRVDSRVNRHLLDNLFFPGSPLHDGAVIIREGRVAAAQAILPLSEKENLARSIGTRHRAALGLSEETDAVVVAVSEETGLITVCQDGQMERRVLKDELADDLRARLGREGASRRTPKGAAGPRTTLKPLLRGLGQKLFALVLGIGIFLLAHRSVQDTRTFTLRVAAEPQSLERSAPTGGTLSILLPSDDLHVAAPALGARVSLRVTAAQVELDALGAELGAFVRVDETWIGSERELRVDDLVVGGERASKNLEIEWTDGRPPRLIVERYAEAEVVPAVASFAIAAPENEGAALLPPRGLEIDAGSLEFDPPVARVRGPADQIAALGGPTARLPFAPVDLSRRSGPSFTMALSLSQEDGRDLELMEPLFLRGSLRSAQTLVAQVDLDVALVSFEAAGGPARIARFEPPTRAVRASILTRGLIPEGTDESTKVVLRQEILGFVREHARVFVDVDRYDDSPGRRIAVEIGDLDALWREQLGPAFALAKTDPSASLTLEIDEEDRTVALEEKRKDDGNDGR